MTPIELKRTARIAGLWYLTFALGPFYLLYVPSKVIEHDNPGATAAHVLAHETLFRWGILTETVGSVVFIGLAMALYRLLADVDCHRARQMVALVLISATLGLVTVIFNVAALAVFRGSNSLTAFDQHTREAVGMLFIRLHSQGTLVNEIFWGLWLLPFGSLVVRSRFLPRWLGYWLLLDGVCWVVTGVCGFLAPSYTDVLFRALQPAFLAELAALLWLLVVGAKDMPRTESAVATT